jgi:hypothetical protein
VGFKKYLVRARSRNTGQGSGAGEGVPVLRTRLDDLSFVLNIYRNKFVTIPLLIFMLAWRSGGYPGFLILVVLTNNSKSYARKCSSGGVWVGAQNKCGPTCTLF